MKFEVMLMACYNDGTADKKAIYNEQSLNAALADFHKYMGQYINSSNVQSVTCIALNTLGTIYKNQCWIAPSTTEQNVTQ